MGGVWTYALDLARGLARATASTTTLAVLGPAPTADQAARARRRSRALTLVCTGLPLDWTGRIRDEHRRCGRGAGRDCADERGADLVQLQHARAGRRRRLSRAARRRPPFLRRHLVARACRDGAAAGRFPLAHGADARRACRRGRCRRRPEPPPSPQRSRRPMACRHPPRSSTTAARAVLRGRRDLAGTSADFVFTAGRLWDEGKNIATLDAARLAVDAGSCRWPVAGTERRQRSNCGTLRPLGRLCGRGTGAGGWTGGRSSSRRRATSRSAWRCSKRPRPAARSCSSDIPTFRELWDGAALFVPPRDDVALAGCASQRIAADRATPAPHRRARHASGRAATRRSPWPPRSWPCVSRGSCAGSLCAAHGRKSRHEARLFHPFARLLLEPRQCAFPARRAARVACARPRRARSGSPAGPGAWTTCCATTAPAGLDAFHAAYPELRRAGLRRRSRSRLRHRTAPISSSCTSGTSPALVAASAGARRRGARFVLLFHDTHHRAVSDPDAIRHFDLDGYDGVLAFGEALARSIAAGAGAIASSSGTRPPTSGCFARRQRRAARGPRLDRQLGRRRAHARNSSEFLLRAGAERQGFRSTSMACAIPQRRSTRCDAMARAIAAGCQRRRRRRSSRATSPPCMCRAASTSTQLPGIPTIRVFEALACGIPLVSAPWQDTRGPVHARARTILVARDGAEMTRHLRDLCQPMPALRPSLVAQRPRHHPRPPHLRASRARNCSTIAGALRSAPHARWRPRA